MLKLTSFSANNYKSLRNASFKLASSIVVLVGRNNTGKYNILDVFDFLAEASVDPNKALQKRGTNALSLLWGQSANEKAEITLEFEVPSELRDAALQLLNRKHPTDPNGTGTVTRLSREDVAASDFLKTLRYSLEFGRTFAETIVTNDPVNGVIPLSVSRKER